MLSVEPERLPTGVHRLLGSFCYAFSLVLVLRVPWRMSPNLCILCAVLLGFHVWLHSVLASAVMVFQGFCCWH